MWNPFDFNASLTYWNSNTTKIFLDGLGSHLGFTCKEDWYKVTEIEIETQGGTRLLQKYRGFVYKLLNSVYPNQTFGEKRNGTFT